MIARSNTHVGNDQEHVVAAAAEGRVESTRPDLTVRRERVSVRSDVEIQGLEVAVLGVRDLHETTVTVLHGAGGRDIGVERICVHGISPDTVI